MANANALLVVAGRDTNQRPHAARFSLRDEDAVTKAAVLMGLQIGIARTADARKAAAALTAGRLFGTGRALVPYVKDDVFEALCSAVEFTTPVVPAIPGPSGGGAVIGQTVLCYDPPNEGWWEAIIVDVDPDKQRASVRWRDFPKIKPFERAFAELAIVGSLAAPAKDAEAA